MTSGNSVRKQLKQKVHGLDPTVRIGKNGITDSIVAEVKKQLQQKKIIKVKFLKNIAQSNDVKPIAEELAKTCNAKIVNKTGFVVTYAIQGVSATRR